ncbi:MAG TPA: MetQ/NlpA family ABC transporter substrate-binding protein [Anaerolineales bacterium]|nr:MetQ/NlpA family ABC transporter substrate-binding protein [Anaerolineales bacterium]
MKYKLAALLIRSVLILSACSPAVTSSQEAPLQAMEAKTLRIAVLPIIDALPMFVADQEALFEKHGVNVEFIPVASAPERDQILAAGQADGTINETLAVMAFNKESVQMQVVRYALRPTAEHGHFFITASGQSGITSVEALKGVEIGVSQGTVIEYVTERLLQAEGFRAGQIQTVAVPKIPDRMALLASGELQAGVLPDPLASLVVGQGGVIVADDSSHPEYGFSVISFRKAVIDANPEAVRAFLAAIEEATALINADPAKYKNVLGERELVPPPLLETYQPPVFPMAGVPTAAEWQDALNWLHEKDMLSTDVSYADSVNGSLLP